MIYAYERVSTIKQDERRQEIRLEGIKFDKRFIEKLTGKNANRPELHKLIVKAKTGDQIYVEAISRLGRNVDDLRTICKDFKEKGITVHFAKEGFNTDGDMYKFLLTILGAVSEMERELIVERVNEGIQKAKIYGTRSGKAIGRPERKDTIPPTFSKYYSQWRNKEIKGVEFARLVEMSTPTLYRYVATYEGKLKGDA